MSKTTESSLLRVTSNGEEMVHSTALYRRLPFANGRHADWISRCRQKLDKINLNFPEMPFEHRFERKGDNYLLSVRTALAYLTFGPNNYQTGWVKSRLELQTGISLSGGTKEFVSRHEDAFAMELEETLDGLFPYDLAVVRQKKIGNYRVDFYLEPDEYGEKRGIGPYIIEFDEAYHRGPIQTERDCLRDAEILHQTGIKVIRVPIEKAELWMDICFQYYGVGVEEILRKWLAKDVDEKGRLYSKSISEYMATDMYAWFDKPKTNMELGSRILDFLGVTYEIGRSYKGRYFELQQPVTFLAAA